MSFFVRPATSILHPTDFSETSEKAFAHALAIALKNRARLTILHIEPDAKQGTPWHEYPSVRKTLERWGLLEPGSRQSDVNSILGIEVEKSSVVDKNVIKSIVNYVEQDFYDLIVMATDDNRQPPFTLGSHVAMPVSQKTHLPTFFIPQDVKGCVSVEDGSTHLKNVLLPVDNKPDAQPVLERIAWAMDNLKESEVNITLLYVGAEKNFPKLKTVELENATWHRMTRGGDPATAITRIADEIHADAIAMVTEGKHGILDAVRGSTVQRVLRHAPCPIFAMPAGM